MKILKSDRGIDLVSDFDSVRNYPCVSVEKHNKWYSLYLVTEDHNVLNIENEVNADPLRPGTFSPEFIRIWNDYVLQGDHCWCPAHVCGVLKAFNMYIGVWAYVALVMMWVEQHIEQPGFEIDYLPSFDLYQSVVTPDTEYEPVYTNIGCGYITSKVRKQGDISLCNSFTEEERKQFRYYVPNPKIPDYFILREISSVNKKTEYPAFKHAVAVDEANPVLLDSHIKLSDDELTCIFDGSINGLTKYHGIVAGPANDPNISEYGVIEKPLEYSEEAMSKLNKIDTDDTETAHQQADEVLCNLLTKLGYTEVVEKWKSVPKWYS